jgi:hypothetical protein
VAEAKLDVLAGWCVLQFEQIETLGDSSGPEHLRQQHEDRVTDRWMERDGHSVC